MIYSPGMHHGSCLLPNLPSAVLYLLFVWGHSRWFSFARCSATAAATLNWMQILNCLLSTSKFLHSLYPWCSYCFILLVSLFSSGALGSITLADTQSFLNNLDMTSGLQYHRTDKAPPASLSALEQHKDTVSWTSLALASIGPWLSLL